MLRCLNTAKSSPTSSRRLRRMPSRRFTTASTYGSSGEVRTVGSSKTTPASRSSSFGGIVSGGITRAGSGAGAEGGGGAGTGDDGRTGTCGDGLLTGGLPNFRRRLWCRFFSRPTSVR